METGPYEKMSCCPFCGGGYEEAVECDECGKVIPESEACFSEPWHKTLCPECYQAEEDAEEECAAEEEEYDKPLVTADYTEVACKDSVASVYEQYENLDDEQLTKFNYKRPNHLSTVRLDDVPWGSLLKKPLTALACCWESLSCSIIADHDPSEKSDAESHYEKFVLESVLSTNCIPGQWRCMIARALLFWLRNSSDDMNCEDRVRYYWIAAQLDPSVYCFYTTQVIDAYRVRDTAHRCTMHAEAITLLRHDVAKARKNHRGLVVDIEGHKYALDAAAIDILMNPDFIGECIGELQADEQAEGGDD